ncbi:MAG: sigma-70 family RNA polymerase sigma factor [Blastocatellia bacterium]|nr:sigma-70 family RNA polymerase sigma factor [Blastocatellia bacterium]
MPSASPDQITRLLLAWSAGESAAFDALLPLVYDELHRLAHRYLGRERRDHTLQTTALVNEAYLRLIDSSRVQWQNRAHFFAISAQLMRRILVDFARGRRNLKRGGEGRRVLFDDALLVAEEREKDLVALDEALSTLSALNPRQGRVVELRFFGGLSIEETAEALAVSIDTVKRDWRLAKVWLLRELDRTGGDGAS